MKLPVLFIAIMLSFAYAKEVKRKCEELQIRGKIYRKDIIALGLNRPYQLGLLKHQHKIFFSYNVGSDDTDTFKVGYIQKNHTEHKVLENVTNGFAIAVDNEKNVVYLGGSDGIYKYVNDSETEKILSDHNIWDLFQKKHLYFINFPQLHLYKLYHHESGIKHERVQEIHEEINAFAVDKDGDIFFTNDTGLFMVKKGSKNRVMLSDKKFRCIELNNKEEVHLCEVNAIFVANKKEHKIEMIVEINNVFGLAFDHDDNIIYSNPHQIVRLLPEKC